MKALKKLLWNLIDNLPHSIAPEPLWNLLEHDPKACYEEIRIMISDSIITEEMIRETYAYI